MALSAGTKLGSYEVVAPLGAGGMGEVYRARDTKLNRDVAIKILPDALASDPAARARFEREAQAVAALSHPNILGIFDFGVEGGTPFKVADATGMRGMSVLVTPDNRTVVYNVNRYLTDLYLVEGLK